MAKPCFSKGGLWIWMSCLLYLLHINKTTLQQSVSFFNRVPQVANPFISVTTRFCMVIIGIYIQILHHYSTRETNIMLNVDYASIKKREKCLYHKAETSSSKCPRWGKTNRQDTISVLTEGTEPKSDPALDPAALLGLQQAYGWLTGSLGLPPWPSLWSCFACCFHHH